MRKNATWIFAAIFLLIIVTCSCEPGQKPPAQPAEKVVTNFRDFFESFTLLRGDYLGRAWTKYFLVCPPGKTAIYIRQPFEVETKIAQIFQTFLDDNDFYLDGVVAVFPADIFLKESGYNSERLWRSQYQVFVRIDPYSSITSEDYEKIGQAYMADKPVKIKGTIKMPLWADSEDDIRGLLKNQVFIEVDSVTLDIDQK